MPTTHLKLSAGEFEVLKILWRLDSATVAEVRDVHGPRGLARPAYTTTMTVLGRLVHKEAARVDKSTQPFRYRAALRRDTLLRRRLRDFVELSYEGEVEHLLADLLRDGHLSTEAAKRVLQTEQEESA